MEGYTKNGLLLLFIGLVITIIGSLILGVYQFLFPIEDMQHIFGYIGFAGISSIGGLISLIGAILFFMGRKEFGEKHQQFVVYAVVVLVVGIIASAVIGGVGTFLSIASSIREGVTIDSIWPAISIFISTLVGSITGGLTYIFALYQLEDEKGKALLYVAFFVSVLTTMVIAYLTMGSLQTLFENIPTNGSGMDPMFSFNITSSISQYSLLGIIGNLLWAVCLFLPYKRIKNGELIPMNMGTDRNNPSFSDRICPECKKTIPNDSLICPYCGKEFESYR